MINFSPRISVQILLVLACLVSPSAWSQEFRATVTGRVVDAAGLPIPGVTVSATNTQTNEIATLMSHAGTGCPMGPCRGCPHNEVTTGACLA